MRKAPICLIAALLVGGCSVSAPVVGKVGLDDKKYLGTATGYMDRTGTIDMANQDGNRCVGHFRYIGAKSGFGVLTCSDGREAQVLFNGIGTASGYGYGVANDGSPVRFYYGLDDVEGEIYLATKKTKPDAKPNPKEQAPKAKKGELIASGSGFVISDKGHLLTNAHVIDGCGAVVARLRDGTVLKTSYLAADPTNDLAILRLLGPVPAVAKFAEPASYRQGDPVVVYGFPLSDILATTGNLTTGTLSALSGMLDDSNHLQISAPIQPGNSGGPVADSQGRVIGVVVSKLNIYAASENSIGIAQNINFAIKDAVAKSFLRAHDVPYAEAKKGTPLSTADVGDMMKSYVVFLGCLSD